MASQVLSGSGNVSYTNNTGENVRIIINYMARGSSVNISLSWGSSGASAPLIAIGRNLAYFGSVFTSPVATTIGATGPSSFASTGSTVWANNAVGTPATSSSASGAGGTLPTELMIAPGQTFSADCGAYNIVVIPEGG